MDVLLGLNIQKRMLPPPQQVPAARVVTAFKWFRRKTPQSKTPHHFWRGVLFLKALLKNEWVLFNSTRPLA